MSQLPKTGDMYQDTNGAYYKVLDIDADVDDEDNVDIRLEETIGDSKRRWFIPLAKFRRSYTLITPPLPPAAIEVGSVVRLKSGGPRMTVSDMRMVDDDDITVSVYYVPEYGSEGRIIVDDFPLVCLTLYTGE